MSASRRRRAVRSLPGRLLTAQAIVLLAGVVTAGTIAALVGPPLFHHHILEAGLESSAPEIRHVEEAYRTASFLSLGVAAVIAAVCALSVTWYFGSRLRRPFDTLTDAADQVSGGDYSARVELQDAGPELERLADAFNSMASQIEHTEETRRRLLTDLAHELRTPIATLGAWADGLEDGVIEWNGEAHGVLRQQVSRLQRLAEDMSAVSRAEEGNLNLHLEPLRVSEVLQEAVRAHAAAYAAAGLVLDVIDDRSGAVVAGDRERLAQVLANLLNNALRHTPAGGTVTLSALASRGEVTMAVTDTGDGISAEQLGHVFERFYRGDQARGTAHPDEATGTGIGLTITKALVEAHRGRINATSAGPGCGATFSVTLPAQPS